MKDVQKLIRENFWREDEPKKKINYSGTPNPVVIYSAVCIEDPAEIAKIDAIRNEYVPANQGWRKPKDYHMTIGPSTFPNTLRKKGDLNQEVVLTVVAIGNSNSAIALEVEGYYSRNKIPHITLAFSKHGGPEESNQITHWAPMHEVQIKGIIRQVAEGNVILKENVTQAAVSNKDVQDVKGEGELYYPKMQIIDGRVFVNYPKNKGSYSIDSFKKHILDLKLDRISNLLLSKGIKVRNSQTTVSRYIKFRDREIRISDHPNRHFYGLDIRVNWKEKVADMFNKILATIAAANGTTNSNSINESVSKKNWKSILNSDEALAILDTTTAKNSTWTEGGCAILAYALKMAFGYEIYCIFSKVLNHVDHFVCKTKDGEFIDYYGNQKDMVRNWKRREPDISNKRKWVLRKFEPGMNTGNIPIDMKASKQLAKLIKGKLNTLTESVIPQASTMYHGTSDTKYDSIMTNGLNSPYLTNDYSKAEYYAEVASEEDDGDPIIFEVKVPSAANLEVDYPELDEPVTLGDDDMKNRIKKAYKTYIKQHPESYDKKLGTISVAKQDYWVSLNTTNSVAYKGNIPPQNLTVID